MMSRYNGEALVYTYINGNCFDIILLDIEMKEMNGLETVKKIRKLDKDVIIIFITSQIEYVFQGRYKVV